MNLYQIKMERTKINIMECWKEPDVKQFDFEKAVKLRRQTISQLSQHPVPLLPSMVIEKTCISLKLGSSMP